MLWISLNIIGKIKSRDTKSKKPIASAKMVAARASTKLISSIIFIE